jgi:glycosyltransferase involved in cell wall biosynthesis
VEVVAPYDIEVQPDRSSSIKIHRYRYVWPKKFHILGHSRSLKADVKLHPLVPFLLPLFVIASIIKLINVATSMKADVIHSHWVLPNGLSAAIASKILKIPFIISLHGSDIFMADKNKLFRFVAKWVFSQSSYVTACSQELHDRALKINPDINIQVLAWGADPTLFKPLENREEIRARYGWKSEEIIITALGRLVYKKGFDHLISIIPEIKVGNENFHFVIGGSGPLEENLKSLVNQLNIGDKVSFPGQIPWNEVPEFLAASDIFVLPSQRDKAGNLDGLPTVLLEAMACGLPCIASDIGGVSLVIKNKKNGYLIDPKNKFQLIDKLTVLISQETMRNNLRNNARSSVVKKYNWDQVSIKFEKIFHKSLKNPSKKRLGQLYRIEYLKRYEKDYTGEKILDIGCHDGEWLSNIEGRIRVCLDVEINKSNNAISYVKADGTAIPFPQNTFDLIYLLDVIEHVNNDKKLVKEVIRVLKPKGKLILTTPHIGIKIFPTFLTKWVSLKWGHTLRQGYNPNLLIDYFEKKDHVELLKLKSFGYRNFYLPLRLLYYILPNSSKKLLHFIVDQESKNPYGDDGFLLLEVIKRADE